MCRFWTLDGLRVVSNGFTPLFTLSNRNFIQSTDAGAPGRVARAVPGANRTRTRRGTVQMRRAAIRAIMAHLSSRPGGDHPEGRPSLSRICPGSRPRQGQLFVRQSEFEPSRPPHASDRITAIRLSPTWKSPEITVGARPLLKLHPW